MKPVAKIALSNSDKEQDYMDVEQYKWLGIVYPTDVRQKVVFITPLAFYDKLAWNFVSQNEIRTCFPNNGKVALFSEDFPDTERNQLRCFAPIENPYIQNREDQKHSLYQIKDIRSFAPTRFAQILYRTTTAASSYEIPHVLNHGIELEECISKTIYIAFQEYLYGPISLERIGDLLKPRQYIRSSSNGGEELIVSVYPIPNDIIHSIGEISSTFDIIDEEMLYSPIRQEDWSLPQVVIKRALQASKIASKQFANDVSLVDKRIRELAQLSSTNGTTTPHISPATIDRAKYIVAHQVEQLHDLHSFIDAIGPEHPLMQKAKEQIVVTESERIKQTVEERTRKERDQLLKVRKEIDEASGIFDDVNVTVQQAKAELAQLQEDIHESIRQRELDTEELQQFQQEMQKELTQLREEPVQVLAKLQFSASLLNVLQNSNQNIKSPFFNTISAPHPSSSQLIVHEEHFLKWNQSEDGRSIKLQELQNLLQQKARQTGVSLKLLRLSIASLLAGLIPVLNSITAPSFLSALANLIAQGRFWSISVPLTSLSPLDLFGTIDKQNYDFIPNADSLADIILQARKHPDDIAIVLLEGIDRVPAMPVLVPILRSYLDSQQDNKYATALHLFHSRSLAPGNPYLDIATFNWPSNLLLAVTCDSDMSSPPIPEACYSWFTHLEQYKVYARHPTSQLTLNSSHVLHHLWQSWNAEAGDNNAQNSNEVYHKLDYRQRKFGEILTNFNISNVEEIVQQLWSQQFEEQENDGEYAK